MSIVRCKNSFVLYDRRGGYQTVSAGALLDHTNPLVVGREALFEPVEDAAAKRATGEELFVGHAAPVVEAASAEPGEPRRMGRRRKVETPAIAEVPAEDN